MTRHPHARSAGFTLIEVLVAVLIFSFGLLGLVGLHARAVQYSTGSEDSSRAALLANEMGTAILTSATAAAGLASAPDAAYTAWQTKVQSPANGGLPNGIGSVTTVASTATTPSTATITLTWLPTTAATGTTRNRYVTQVILP